MNWRSLPDLSPRGWQRELAKLGSPMAPFAADIARAASPHGCLALAFVVKESRADTLRNEALQWHDHNPWNITTGRWVNGGHDWMSYPSYAACAANWKRKLTDPNGPYAKTVTLEELVEVYAPKRDGNNVEEYVAQTKQRIAAYAAADGEESMPVTFGRVPRPAFRLDPVIKPEGHGWSNYGPRNVLLGFVYHNVLGRARYTGDYFRNPNEPHGYNALTDWGVCNSIDGADWDGVILQWNDPDSHRSPWASGDSRPDSGDGPAMQALCNRLGLNLNQATEAIEISRLRNGDAVSANCMASLINLTAWRADAKARVSYETWPKNNHGVQMTLTHAEFGKVECNAGDVIAEIIEGVHGRLKHYQTQGDPVEPPANIFPNLPVGIDDAFMKAQFPQADPKGTVTPLWLSYGTYPKLDRIETRPNGRLFVFYGVPPIFAPKQGKPFIVGKP